MRWWRLVKLRRCQGLHSEEPHRGVWTYMAGTKLSPLHFKGPPGICGKDGINNDKTMESKAHYRLAILKVWTRAII